MASASLRLNNGRSNSTNGRTKSTISCWVKRSRIGVQEDIWSWGENNSSDAYLRFDTADNVEMHCDGADGTYNTTALYRDTGAWYHFVFSLDGSNSTANLRRRFWINGVQIDEGKGSISTFSAAQIGNTAQQDFWIGGRARSQQSGATEYFDGQITHFHYCDGYSYAASDFGETDSTTGIWKPKTSPSVSYGDNGFFLKMDNSANMGLDSSGNGVNLTTSGTILQYKDTPSNNMPQLNHNDKYAGSITNAGRTITNENNNATGVMSTLAVDTGKWYWEAKVKDTASDTFNVGMRKTGLNNYGVTGWSYGAGAFVYAVNGYIYKDGSQSTNTGTTAAVGDIIGFIVDLDAGTVKLQKNGADMYSGNAAVTGLNTGDFWHVVQGASQAAVDFNFGDGYFGTTAITSAGSNGNGLLFEYDVPSGHYGISTKNIASNS